ncbi:MAG: hypothetical protein JF593_02480 [Novosphingobium sp.]|nr:hypothetical protein [Novosphingobium sp.]
MSLALGCERIICIVRELDPEVIALQHAAEHAGARFQASPGARGLIGSVAAVDDLIVFADGLLGTPDLAAELIELGPAVVVQPIETGLAAGFERIDLNHAAGGLMRLPGRLVERLAELPSDCDVASALQRIALQAGVPQRPLPSAAGDATQWTLVHNEAEAHAAEARWIARHTRFADARSPSQALARFAVRRLGPTLLHAGSGGNAIVAAAVAVALFALGAGWFSLTATALVLSGTSWLLRRSAALLTRVERDSLRLAKPWLPREELFDWTLDGCIVAITVWGQPGRPEQGLVDRAFAPLILIALLRLAPRLIDSRWSGWLDDRMVLALVLAGAAVAGVLPGMIEGLAMALAVLALAWPAARTRLTQA